MSNLNTATILTKIVAGILTSKAIAIFIGVEGMALIGNIRNFVSVMQSFSILGFYNGLVRSIAEFKNDTLMLSKTISTAYYLGFLATLIGGMFCYYFADGINDFLFTPISNYSYIIKIFGVALPFYSLNMFCFGIMNGFSKYKILLVINMVGQVLGLSVTLLLIYQNNIDGALLSAVIAPSLIFLITLVGISYQRSLVSSIKFSNLSTDVLKRFGPFALMALVSSIAIPLISIVIRNYIIEHESMNDAGYWEAMNRISDYYLMFVNSIITLYILPRFVEITEKSEFRKEVFDFYKSIIPVFGLGLITLYLLRPFIVKIVFSVEFQPVEDLFFWQLLGDFIKVLSMVIAYQFIAKKMFWHFIIIEIFLVVVLYMSSVYLIDIYGVKGAVMGHFFSYLMHYLLILMMFSSSLFGIITQAEDPSDL